MPEDKPPAPVSGPGVPLLPEEPADAHYNPQPHLLCANADWSAIVDCDSAEASFSFDPADPNIGTKAKALVEKHQAARGAKAEATGAPASKKV